MSIWTIIQIGLIVAAAAVVGIGSRMRWPGLPDDNKIEEAAEEVIRQETGLIIDLTPESEE